MLRLAFLLLLGAQAADAGYQLPPKAIVAMLDAPPTPSASVGPDRRTVLYAESVAMPGIAEVAQEELRLAGLRLAATTGAESRVTYLRALSLQDTRGGEARTVTGFPEGSRVRLVGWSPDGRWVGATVTDDASVRPWIVEVATAAARPLGDVRVVAALGVGCAWWPDSSGLLCSTVPADRGPAPTRATEPVGPIVQENSGQKKPTRTNPDALRDEDDAKLLDHHLTAQLARIGLDGAMTAVGAPDRFLEATPSPDGRHLLVSRLRRPYSYTLELDRFPHRVEVWTAAGAPIATLADNPLADQVPVDHDAVPTGPRDVAWRADADATVCWVEARDGGDPKQAAEVRDEVMCQAAPFQGAPTSLIRLATRFSGLTWGRGVALVSEGWWKDRRTRTTLVQPDKRAAPRVVWDRSSEDRYSDPGRPLMQRTDRGTWLMAEAPGGGVYLTGAGASPEGDRPFLDTLDLRRGTTRRLWRSEGEQYEYVVGLVDGGVLTRRETPTEPPQFYVRPSSGEPRRLTSFPHPAPELAAVGKQLIRYQRADGVELRGMLYLPPGFRPGVDAPLPLLMWAYPAEFKSAAAAGQVTDSPWRFVRVERSGPLFALTQGYAVLDNPAFPIVGEGEAEPNDSYVAQLTADAQAAVDAVVGLGVADRERIAIGGHSYGAFTTANLLAHTDLFRAGIARSGAYNRTLTPFGFQSEDRTFWEAPEVYQAMSPFTHAARIDEPLLLVHGAADNNQGTWPIQSERLFQAMQGLGGWVRYVVLPAESHSYRARESVMHVMWEMTTFLDRTVKNAPPREAKPQE